MNAHPLFQELKQICQKYNLDVAKAHLTFDAYQELSEVKKLVDLKYFFSDELRLFYITGKTEETDEVPDAFIPILSSEKMSPQEMRQIQVTLSPKTNQFKLLIRDRDSTSTCYCITKGLIKPDSPDTCKKKKDLEVQKYNFEKENVTFNGQKLLEKAFVKENKKIREVFQTGVYDGLYKDTEKVTLLKINNTSLLSLIFPSSNNWVLHYFWGVPIKKSLKSD